MGKNGKARKRQRIERQLCLSNGLADSSDEESLSTDGDGPAVMELDALLMVLKCLSCRLDLYEDKKRKPLRIAIYPLIEIQQSKFFEDVTKLDPISDEEFDRALPASVVAKASAAIAYFTANTDQFAAEQYKHIRRALHPLVVHTNKKAKLAKSSLHSSSKSNNTPHSATSFTQANEESSGSLSNRISNCFRLGDHGGAQLALEALHRLCTSDTTAEAERRAALPKLGSLQRWVRDCDIAAMRQTTLGGNTGDSAMVINEAQLQQTALLLLHAVLRVTCLLKLRTSATTITGATTTTSAVAKGTTSTTASGASGAGSFAAMRASMLQKRPHKANPVATSTTIAAAAVQTSVYTSAVKMEYPAFSVPPVYPEEAYFAPAAMVALIEVAAADSRMVARAILNTRSSNSNTWFSEERSCGCPGADGSGSMAVATIRPCCTCVIPPAAAFPSMVRVVSHVPGPQRRPPTAHDLNIFYTAPGTIRYFHTAEEISTYCGTACAVHGAGATAGLGGSTAGNDASSTIGGNVVVAPQLSPLPSPLRPTTIALPHPVRHDVSSVPGAMLLTGVLTPLECAQFIVAAERLGYTPDAVDGIDNVVWLADPSLLDPLYKRVQPLLPQVLEGHRLTGINARLRLFRYYPGAVYRPHIDGAWPGSGLSADGAYTDDAFAGGQHSRLTFLVYLNGDFEGGTTTYFLPGEEQEGAVAEAAAMVGSKAGGGHDGASGAVGSSGTDRSSGGDGGDGGDDAGKGGACCDKVGRIEVRRVKPQVGSVLVFPHGSASGSLVHEGSAVLSGVKYVIRTDVLYTAEACC